MDNVIILQHNSFVSSKYLNQYLSQTGKTGSIVTFEGYVRDFNDSGSIQKLYIEYYPEMTEKTLKNVEEKALKSFQIEKTLIVHRYGLLDINEIIVLVAISSSHRKEAFKACEFIIDTLKCTAPFWKKEISSKDEKWVQSQLKDKEYLDHWDRITSKN